MYIHIRIHQVHGIHFTILIKHFKYNIYIYINIMFHFILSI